MKLITQTVTGAALAALAVIAVAGTAIAAPARQEAAQAAACQAAPDHDLLIAYRGAMAERCVLLHDRACDDPALATLRAYLIQERDTPVPAALLTAPTKR